MLTPDILARVQVRDEWVRLVPVVLCGRGLDHVGPRLTGAPHEDLVPLAHVIAPADTLGLAEYRPNLAKDPYCRSVPGGYALYAANDLLARPTCCGDLGDIHAMADLATRGFSRAAAMEGWLELWVGHPGWVVHIDGEHLFVSPGVEPDSRRPASPEPDEPIWRFPLESFLAAARHARAEVEAAVPRWEAALTPALGDTNASIAAHGLLAIPTPPERPTDG